MSFLNVLGRLKTAAYDRQHGLDPQRALVQRDDLKELLNQFGKEDSFSRRLHTEKEKALDENKALTAERDALSAQVEALHKAIETALHGTVFDEVGNRDDDGLIPFGETKTAVSVLQNALDATPQHHLRQVRADAYQSGFVKGAKVANESPQIYAMGLESVAKQYAESIRQGEVE